MKFERATAHEPRASTVNNVQSGPTDTDMNPAKGGFADSTLPYIALQRCARPEEIASFITGVSLLADGGYAA